MKCPPSHILDFLDLRHLFSASISTARIYIYCLNLLFFKFFFFLKRGVSYHTLLYIDKTFTTSQHRYFSTNHTQFTKIIQENKIMLYHYDNQHIPTLNVNCQSIRVDYVTCMVLIVCDFFHTVLINLYALSRIRKDPKVY